MSSVARYARVVAAATAAGSVALGAALANSESDLHFWLASAAGRFLRLLDPETAHRVGIHAAAAGLYPRQSRADDAKLAVKLWDKSFPNPIGLAAGFDKDAEAVDGLLGMGLGFMEVGSITPAPQPGNPKPRCFRLPELEAVINRYGFNSQGADRASERLQEYTLRRGAGHTPPGLLFVNLGKNKTTEDAAADYCAGVEKLSRFADVVVINISSPNTPGLRSLQGKAQLDDLVRRVQKSMDQIEYPSGRPPLLVKIAPDLSEADKDDIAAVMLATRVDGLVIGNTTVRRPGAVAQHPLAAEAGGLSGEPLFDLSTQVLRDMYVRTNGRIPIIGCGGVSSGKQAYAKIRAGASLVELYTGLAYKGPLLIPDMKRELLACLEADGFNSIQEAVAADHKLAPVAGAPTKRAWFGWGRAKGG